MYVDGKEQLMVFLYYSVPKGFVTERNKRKDGTFDVKFESYG